MSFDTTVGAATIFKRPGRRPGNRPGQADDYDRPALRDRFVRHLPQERCEVTLAVAGIRCAACIGAIERHLQRQAGVESVSINYATRQARVVWQAGSAALADIIGAIDALGYSASPYAPHRQREQLDSEYRHSLKRLAVAGVFGMQVMMLAVALYLADGAIDPRYAALIRWASLLLCLPVVAYSAGPFFRAAWRGAKTGRLTMDAPVSLGIALAFVASIGAVYQGWGEIYFDSVAMFTFLLLTARHVELLVRIRATRAATAWQRALPEMASRVDVNGAIERVAALELRPGDRVRVLPGQAVPVDGHVLEGSGCVDESLLTGESAPVARCVGATVIGGSINLEGELLIGVAESLDDSFASQLQRLLTRAQSERPPLLQFTDRIAGYFIAAVIAIAALVAAYWWLAGDADWLSTTVAVLIITCPCALSLAAPAAISAASAALAGNGLLPTRAGALETLARVTHVVFDKTGTLSDGVLQLCNTRVLADLDQHTALRIAAAIGHHAQHPVARALCQFHTHTSGDETLRVSDVVITPGAGMAATIAGQRWYLGSLGYLVEVTALDVAADVFRSVSEDAVTGGTQSLLMRGGTLVAAFSFVDQLCPEAARLVDELKCAGKAVSILSGDSQMAVSRIANQAGISTFHYRLSPADKLDHIHRLQDTGAVVAMLGDGDNDSPAMARADVSVAMAEGTDIAVTNADLVLLNNHLPAFAIGLHTAQRALTIVRQNVVWAIAYNATALPLAALGYTTPWMAAIGMSISSLVVVLNASRLRRARGGG